MTAILTRDNVPKETIIASFQAYQTCREANALEDIAGSLKGERPSSSTTEKKYTNVNWVSLPPAYWIGK